MFPLKKITSGKCRKIKNTLWQKTFTTNFTNIQKKNLNQKQKRILRLNKKPQNQKKKIDNILASKKLNDAFKKNAIQAVLAAGGVVTETTALQAEAIVAGKATVTTNAFSTALKGLWLNIAPVLATIWPLIVALGALVAAWAIYDNATGAAAENAE